MDNFIEFVHFLNSEKSFELLKTKDPLQAFTEDEYMHFPYSDELLVKYNGFTLNRFQNYIEKQTNIILNEVTDVVHRQNRESITELKNKVIFLKQYIRRYIKTKSQNGNLVHLEDLQIKHSEHAGSISYNSISRVEKSTISGFLEMEFNLIYKILHTYANLENNHLIRIANNETVTGFTFAGSIKVNLRSIYVILEGYLTSSSFDVFEKAFSSVPIVSPLRIKWLLQNRDGNANKRALIYFLSSPLFIEMNDQELAKKIHFCFADKEEKLFPLRTIKENIRQYTIALDNIDSGKTYSDWKSEIDKRIDLIQSLLQNDRK